MIVSSAYTEGIEQVDGRRPVVETHVDDAGKVHTFEYLGEANGDYQAIMTERAAMLNAPPPVESEQEGE